MALLEGLGSVAAVDGDIPVKLRVIAVTVM